MQRREDNVAARLNGNALQPLSDVAITVTDDKTGLPASLYADNGVTPLAQPLMTDNNGYYGYYAANGEYTETFTSARIATFTRKLVLADPDDNPHATKAELAAGSGSSLVTFTQAGAGAVSRSLQAKGRDTVSVKDFGAVGDGATDDTAAINAAIASLGAGGGIVLLPRGDYRITAKLTVSTPVTLAGAGRGFTSNQYSTRILKDGNFVGIEFAQGSAYGGARDFTLHSVNNADVSDGIYITSGRVSLDHVNVQNHGRHGLNVYDANCSSFTRLRLFQNKGNGLHIEGSAQLNVNGMFFHDLDIQLNVGHGVNVQTGFSNFFFGVTLQLNQGYGINIPDGDRNRFFGVYSEGNTQGSLNFGSTALSNEVLFGIASDHITVSDASASNSWDVPGDSRSVWRGGSLTLQTDMRIGNPSSGAAGYLRLQDTGSTYSMTLEGTNASLTMPWKSAGAGKLTMDFDGLAIEARTAPTLLNSWVNFGGSRVVAGFYKDKYGNVHLEGTVKAGTITAAIFTLPAGYRPSGRVQFAVSTLSGATATHGMVIVDSDGNVYAQAGGTTEFSLDGIHFRTAA